MNYKMPTANHVKKMSNNKEIICRGYTINLL